MATAQTQRIRLGLFVQPVGQHVSGWRLTEKLGDPTDIDWLITIAKKAEAGKFDLCAGDQHVPFAFDHGAP
jgi:hypothetical protein